ncbi:MAG: hypothetical protein LJE61_10185 [Thiocapsa sp.]|jgi:hypothetical protein|nr:sigma factor-like helix-turn-helix DNA-binding protein [Thiocapsa sp.]MCG6898075.1 hypothetical protein [Thiocapsa sp.]MCG6985546.1 hypothetical protein [Thiocapsa sp.]
MGAYKSASSPAVRGQSQAKSASCDSPALGFSDPRLDDEGEPALPVQVFCTLEEVAAEMGIRREQVRVIEQRALRKCRVYCEARGLRLEDLLAVFPLGGCP